MCVAKPDPFAPLNESHVLSNAIENETSNDGGRSSETNIEVGHLCGSRYWLLTDQQKIIPIKYFHLKNNDQFLYT